MLKAYSIDHGATKLPHGVKLLEVKEKYNLSYFLPIHANEYILLIYTICATNPGNKDRNIHIKKGTKFWFPCNTLLELTIQKYVYRTKYIFL